MEAKSKVDFIEKYFVKNDGSALDDDLQEAIANIRDALAENERLSHELTCANEMCGGLQEVRERLQAENERLKEGIETQGEECLHRHNLLCEIKEIIDGYFEQALKQK